MYELLFIGAGPHCLTTLLRLLEPDADHSIDQPQRKTTPKAKVLRYWAKQRTDPTHRQHTASWLKQNVAVIDPCGSWMGRWQQQFSGLQIRHLRSSSAVHPDPLDTYALVTYAGSQGRLDETLTLNHIHKTQYFHGPFHTPGAALFEDFCEDLIHRYCLDDLVTKDKVIDLAPVFTACSSSSCSAHPHSSNSSVAGKPLPHPVDHWVVQLDSGQQLTARKVVIGIGSTNKMRMPAVLQQLQAVHLPSSSSSSDGISVPDSAISNTCECCSTESSENSYSFVEWLPADTLPVSRLCIDKAPSKCGSSGSSAVGSFEDILCSSSSSSGGSWSSSISAGSVISPNSTPDNSACGCDTCTEPDGQLQNLKQEAILLHDSSAATIAVAVAALTATHDECNSRPQQQQQQECETAATESADGGAGCPDILEQTSDVASSKQPLLAVTAAAQAPLEAGTAAAAATGADTDCNFSAAAAGTFPWGRMMHAWQLVEAVAAATAACDNRTNTSNNGHNSKGSSRGSKPRQQPTLQDLGLLNPGEAVVIIGGGLTSAHLAQLAAAAAPWLDNHTAAARETAAAAVQVGPKTASSSSSRSSRRDTDTRDAAAPPVTLLMRGEWRVKQFDVDVPYMGRLRHKKLQEFGQLKSFTQRLALIKQVLQGGSMPPEAAAWLQQLQSAGLLAVRQHSTVVAAEWDWQEGQWDIYLEDGDVLHAHRLWLATGSEVNVSSEPIMQQLQQQLPIPIVSGLPALQPTLEWTAGSGVYVLGAYAALQLGPGALNLAGAKTASIIMERQLQRHLGAASLHNNNSSSSLVNSSSKSAKERELNVLGSCGADAQGACLPGTTKSGAAPYALNSAAPAEAGAAECFEAAALGAVASFKPCTALKGSDSLYLAGLASSHMELQSKSSFSSHSSTHSHAAYSAAQHVKQSAGSSMSGAGCAVGLPYSSDQCCGTCWKSTHVAARTGLNARYSRAVGRRY